MKSIDQSPAPVKAFLCHSSRDSTFVIEVAKHLKRNLDGIFCYEEYQRSDTSFLTTINQELRDCNVMVIFVSRSMLTQYQVAEVNSAFQIHQKKPRDFYIILLGDSELPADLEMINTYPVIRVAAPSISEAYRITKEIANNYLKRTWRSDDGLPLNPHLFDYEKDIIQYFIDKSSLEMHIVHLKNTLEDVQEGTPEYLKQKAAYENINQQYEIIRNKQLDGCPAEWPEVIRWDDVLTENELDQSVSGKFRPDNARVIAAALSNYHCGFCMIEKNLCFPEAGPRAELRFPRKGQNLNVAIVVSGGIAPGTNAVIDGITQRHYQYAEKHSYKVWIYGYKDGFQAFENLNQSQALLIPKQDGSKPVSTIFEETSNHVNEGGSILGTSRYERLSNPETRKVELENIVTALFINRIDILYIIGGDGSMKAAHSIWSFAQEYAAQRGLTRKLSVVAIPKTMDNDILWVWQTFGFMSAVERAREFLEHLSTEVKSNPRLGVVQLFGSDSGFVVSHAVLASVTGICDAALIPEVNFSMKELAKHLKEQMRVRYLQLQRGRIPYGFVVLAETAIPTDAEEFLDDPKIGLSEDEKQAVKIFNEKRRTQGRIEGQTDDALRTAGLKIVSKGLKQLLPSIPTENETQPDWDKLRVFTNEPRHLLRATPPSVSDIITAQRLGILAVDNALAGYTDFMVSQWLTEYVLVPLQLVILGRKRIPKEGIFWKSVLAKTGQPSEME